MRFVASVPLSTLLLGQRRFARAENFTSCHGVAESASTPRDPSAHSFSSAPCGHRYGDRHLASYGDQSPRETTSELVKLNPKP